MKWKQFVRQETVLIIAMALAVISMLFVHPDVRYIEYIDFRTLGILFSLMTVMAGLRRQGVFEQVGQRLLAHNKSLVSLVFILVGMCFFGSMFITNDVALLTFVPFTFVVLESMGKEWKKRLVLPVVCMQTVAANLGSMLTPIGNPQNLYLYGKSGIRIAEFIGLMLPYSVISLLMLMVWAVFFCKNQKDAGEIRNFTREKSVTWNKKTVVVYGLLFIICLLVVARILPWGIAVATVLACTFFMDRPTLREVDYSLLLTFVAFFIFIGNLGRIPLFSSWLQNIITGQEILVAVLASQVTSNVPAALLLSGFTQDTEALIIGTNIGGLGTLIASMASLISYRQIARELPERKGKYFRMFTLSNLIFLGVLLFVAEKVW